MARNFDPAAAIPNPALKPLGILIGEWNTVGTHPAIPNTVLHGRCSFDWLEGGAFLIMHSEIDEPGIPTAIAIFGSDESSDVCSMLYFDERGVSRNLEVTLHDNVWKWWRNAPGFSQRFTGTISKDGDTIVGKGQLSRDGSTWEGDLDLTYTRLK
jgi:hypothetical protein